MNPHRTNDRWIVGLVLVTALLVIGVMFFYRAPLDARSHPPYASKLFDDRRIHTIDILYDDWDRLIEEAAKEEYHRLNVVIDGERFEDIGLRAKGNNSLRLTERYGHRRFSLKLEFDTFVTGHHYHGLDKFSLDSSFQDNSYLKSYFAYDMMRFMNVPTPLCSFVWVTVNGDPWGLFLAVEEPEESFALRNFGPGYGKLYKPDYKKLAHENADVHLRYTTDDFDAYDNIWRKSKFPITPKDKRRLIRSLEILHSGENLEQAVDVEAVLRYFVPQVFVVNLDSYLGPTGHNYFLYEQGGRISILPWDYNLAFATYPLAMPRPENNARKYVNYPIDTPGDGEYMRKRPLFHNIMLHKEYHDRYRALFDRFLVDYFASGHFETRLAAIVKKISPWVEQDPTAFISYADYLQGVKTFREFNLLRAQSVRGQLDGTIPSTKKAQRLHPSALLDVGDLWIPDMGEIEDLKRKEIDPSHTEEAK